MDTETLQQIIEVNNRIEKTQRKIMEQIQAQAGRIEKLEGSISRAGKTGGTRPCVIEADTTQGKDPQLCRDMLEATAGETTAEADKVSTVTQLINNHQPIGAQLSTILCENGWSTATNQFASMPKNWNDFRASMLAVATAGTPELAHDFVGPLLALCRNKKLPAPQWDVGQGAISPPFTAVVKVGPVIAKGVVGAGKKIQAKKLAARNCLILLSNLKPDASDQDILDAVRAVRDANKAAQAAAKAKAEAEAEAAAATNPDAGVLEQ